jgi:CubicO group peptidase (beta-lactamase class C family)
MNQEQISKKLQPILNKTVDNKTVFGVSFCIENGTRSLVFSGAAGNLQTESQYFIASTTKLYTSAIILNLASQKAFQLDDPVANYLDKWVMDGLLVIKGVDYSGQVTIRQLLAHTSGLPDYFQQKKANGKSLLEELTAGIDQGWSFEHVIAEVKKMKPAFRPGEEGKALYSDTNFQILGRLIETVSAKPIQTALQEFIFTPLGLQKTYFYSDSQDTRPTPLYYKKNQLHMPLAMTSFGTDGGIVSTSADLMIFLKAFFGGQFFPVENVAWMKQWNRIFFPLEAGVGLTRFKLPRLFSPFKAMPEFIGHSGLSGAVAFYAPEKDIYLTGTVNQISDPGRSFRLMLELINSL